MNYRERGQSLPSDWIESRDAAFQSQADALVAAITSYAEIWGLSAAELLPLLECKQNFDQAMTEQAEQATIYHATVARKQTKREELERLLRQMVRRINNHPGMTDELRKQMKLASPIRASTRTRTLRATGPQPDQSPNRRCSDQNINENESSNNG
jgi:CRP-like cAMP-binding protein